MSMQMEVIKTSSGHLHCNLIPKECKIERPKSIIKDHNLYQLEGRVYFRMHTPTHELTHAMVLETYNTFNLRFNDDQCFRF